MANPILTQDEVEKLIKIGENEHTEFKFKVPSPLIIAKNVAAFANSDGGIIVIGVGENGELRSTDFLAVQEALDAALNFIFPKPKVSSEKFQLHSTSIVAITVQPSASKPVLVDGKILIRSGSEVRNADASDVQRLVEPRNSATTEPNLNDLKIELKHLSEVVSKQNQIIIDL